MGGIGIGSTVKLRGACKKSAAAWSPADLPDLELWLPNSFLATIGDAQPIAQWDDASGLDRHAVQATGTSRPTARLTGGIWEAFFDGVDDHLKATFAAIAQPTTLWVVGGLLTNSGSRQFVDGSGGARQSIYRLSTSEFYRYFAGTQIDSTVATDLDPHSFVAFFNGAGSSLLIDGAVASTANPGAQSMENAFIGTSTVAAGFLHGVIRDAGLCSSVLAGDDLTNLETYLATLV